MLKHNYACLIEGSPDTEPVQGLRLPATRRLVRKTANSAFVRTDFEDQLRAMNVTKLFLAGAFMDGCIGLTAADAAQRGFEVCLVDDALPRHHHGMARRPVRDDGDHHGGDLRRGARGVRCGSGPRAHGRTRGLSAER